MGDVQWTARYNPKTGDQLYFDNKGNISFRPPEGYEAPAPPTPPTRMSVLLGGKKKQQEVRLKKVSKRKQASKRKQNSKREGGSSKRGLSKKGKSSRNVRREASKRSAQGESALTDLTPAELGLDDVGGSKSKRSKKGSKRSKRGGGSKRSKRKKEKNGADGETDSNLGSLNRLEMGTVEDSSEYKSNRNLRREGSHASLNPKFNRETPPKIGEVVLVDKADNTLDIFESKLAQAKVDVVPAHALSDKYTFQNNWRKLENTTTVFKWAPYAHNLGFFTAACYVFFGAVSLLWTFQLQNPNAVLPDNVDKFVVAPLFAGVFTFAAGIAMFIFEKLFGLTRDLAIDGGAAGYARGLFYIACSGPAFFSYATIMSAVISIYTGVINILSTYNRERGKMRGAGYVFSYFDWEEDKGVFYLSMTYIALNVIVFTYLYGQTLLVVLLCFNDADQFFLECPSQAAPFAKGFGNMLNLNCALLIIPILRGILTTVAEKFNQNNVFPIRKAIEFHQIIGSISALAVFGHTAAHYINYIFASETTIILFGKQPWFTGAAIIIVMAVLYSGAHSFAKKANYEVFWYSHHTYTLYFLLLLAHGPKFWQWFFIPVIGLTYEKIKRHNDRMQRKIFVKSVEFTKPVLNINFTPDRIEKFDFREGQYCYILAPQVNNYQWHPFSISSCKGDLERFGYVSLHIRVQDDRNSWTFMLNEYFRQVSGSVGNFDEPYFYDKFHRYDRNGTRLDGLYAGPDGKPLIRIDGPYNAPCQTYSSFRDVILVGSGIGITPGASVLRSILRYKWNKGFYPDTVRFAWVLRQSEAESFAWFIELLVDLMAQVKADRESGDVAKGHYLQINLYVTGAKKKENMAIMAPPPNMSVYRQSFVARDRLEKKSMTLKLKSRRLLDDAWDVASSQGGPGYGKDLIGFNAQDLYNMIQDPTVKSNQQAIIDPNSYQSGNRLEDIWVWNGRPDWASVFQQTSGHAVARNERIRMAKRDGRELSPDEYAELGGITSEVGVCFCGGKAIGRDLRINTRKWSTEEIQFNLNEEFF
eukprot:augustus_masked-scaffold_31-processed-gene-0.36-mRNA-1 protein AED:1.00 eAED:1.00 QI:0/-1/0/0/-1/1/1/0/1037